MINEIKAQMKANEMDERVLTENGAVAYKTTGKSLTDFMFKVSSYRNKTDAEIIKDFEAMYEENPELALRMMFYVRDVREGMGERRLFKVMLSYVATHRDSLGLCINVPVLCQQVMEMGRADDMLILLDTPCRKEVYQFIGDTLKADKRAMEEGKSISLMAKWLPSINTTSKQSVKVAQKIVKGIGMTEKEYRKVLSALRKYSNVVEVKMTNKEWSSIDYNSVTSKANLSYGKAFMKHDTERRTEYLNNLKNGVEGVKINASTAYPCDIVHKYTEGTNAWRVKLPHEEDTVLEEMWKALPDKVKGNSNTLVVADGSGSMTDAAGGNSRVTCLDVANSLAVYFAERAKGEFKDHYITFSERPQLVHLRGNSLLSKLRTAYEHNECANTNVEAVFDLILNTAVRSKMSQDELPTNVLILSDMEFDTCAVANTSDGYYCRTGVTSTLFEHIAEKYKAKGYKMPRLVFWNICSRTGAIPVRENDMGVALVSGFSVNVLDMVMSGETDPYKCIVDTLMNERYAVKAFTII